MPDSFDEIGREQNKKISTLILNLSVRSDIILHPYLKPCKNYQLYFSPRKTVSMVKKTFILSQDTKQTKQPNSVQVNDWAAHQEFSRPIRKITP